MNPYVNRTQLAQIIGVSATATYRFDIKPVMVVGAMPLFDTKDAYRIKAERDAKRAEPQAAA